VSGGVAVASGPEEPTPGTGVAAFGGKDALEVRQSATAARTELARQTATLARQQAEARAEMDRQRQEMEQAFAKRRAELAAMAGPLEEQLKRLTEVMWSVDLYLGRDESLRLVRDGKPAPAETPITLRQRILVMAEESLVLMGVSSARRPPKATGMDAQNTPQFIEWLLQDEAHLNRVLPEPKGIVVLIPTKVKTRSGNAYEDAVRDDANESSYWLLRNGERVYLLTVDPKLRLADRVLPRRSEFAEVFDKRIFGYGGRRDEPVEPGSDEWLEMEKMADARRRHYMRVLLVLEGILDRTPAFHPLPEGDASFLNLDDQESGKIVLIQDGDDALQITDGRPSFRDYQRSLNTLLRPGMRIVGHFGAKGFQDLYDRGEAWRRGGHDRIHPRNASYPESLVPHLIEDRRDGGLVFRYKRTDTVLKRNAPVLDQPGYHYVGLTEVEASTRASCLVMPGDNWVIPIDLAETADLEYYLNSRDNRSDYFLSMVPTLQAALAVKREEAAAEAPFRDLISRLIMAEGASYDEAPVMTEQLVHWWKIANTWSRPLNGEPEHEAKAAKAIVTEYKMRRSHAADDSVDRMVEAGRAVPGAVAVGRDRQGKWRVYAASQDGHHSANKGVFLDIAPIRRDGTIGDFERERILQKRTASALFIAWQAEEWSTWSFGANPKQYLSPSERAQVITELREGAEGAAICVTEQYDQDYPDRRSLAVYSWRSGSPKDAPAAADSGLGRGSSSSPVAAKAFRVVKTAEGVVLRPVDIDRTRFPSNFDTYSTYDHVRRESSFGKPYPDGDKNLEGIRLAWVDDDRLAEVKGYAERCNEAAAAKRQREAEAARVVHRYVEATQAVVRARRDAAIRARFDEDFGPDADDLWPDHLKTLAAARDHFHPHDLFRLISSAMRHGEPFIGETLQQLSDVAWKHSEEERSMFNRESRVDVGEYGDIVVPDAPKEPEGPAE